jgi:hypothetical protein
VQEPDCSIASGQYLRNSSILPSPSLLTCSRRFGTVETYENGSLSRLGGVGGDGQCKMEGDSTELASSRRRLGSGERALFPGRSLQSPVDKRGRVARDAIGAPLTTFHLRNLLPDYISFTGTLPTLVTQRLPVYSIQNRHP